MTLSARSGTFSAASALARCKATITGSAVSAYPMMLCHFALALGIRCSESGHNRLPCDDAPDTDIHANGIPRAIM
ncbi:hypothetical protein KC353_g19135 [Hortaea werneckii]|nr:hypothetical protein KC353_g19135 [Hortaea werneckii]